MNNKAEGGQVADLNTAIRELHKDLKSLVLTCGPDFPKQAADGLVLLVELADLQAIMAAYGRELLVRLFRSGIPSAEGTSSILRNAADFIRLWEERAKLPKQEGRSENEIDAAIRTRVSVLLEEMRLFGEEKLRALNRNEDIPEILYYVSTVEQALCWFGARYLARMTGELAEMET